MDAKTKFILELVEKCSLKKEINWRYFKTKQRYVCIIKYKYVISVQLQKFGSQNCYILNISNIWRRHTTETLLTSDLINEDKKLVKKVYEAAKNCAFRIDDTKDDILHYLLSKDKY